MLTSYLPQVSVRNGIKIDFQTVRSFADDTSRLTWCFCMLRRCIRWWWRRRRWARRFIFWRILLRFQLNPIVVLPCRALCSFT